MPERIIKVKRKGYTKKSGTCVAPATYKKRQRGKGTGNIVLPPVAKPGLMTAVATEMNYDRPTDIPDNKIPEFIENLVDEYGARGARGMIIRQYVYRKNMRGEAKSKFKAMLEYMKAKYPTNE